MEDRADAGGSEIELSPSGQGTTTLGSGGRGARGSQRCLERLWECAGCTQLPTFSHRPDEPLFLPPPPGHG